MPVVWTDRPGAPRALVATDSGHRAYYDFAFKPATWPSTVIRERKRRGGPARPVSRHLPSSLPAASCLWADRPAVRPGGGLLRRALLAGAIAVFLTAGAPGVGAVDLESTAWSAAARRTGLPPALLYAVALTESARMRDRRHAAPWPYAIHTPGGARYYASHAEASAALSAHLAEHPDAGIDVGLMQINVHWHGHRVRSPHDLLDPAVSLRVAAEILAECIASAPGDLELGVGRYHQWRDERVARDYGRKVLRIAARLVERAGETVAAL